MLYIGTDIKSDRALMAKSTLGWVKPKLLLPDRSLLLADGKQVFVLQFERYLSSFLSFSFFLSFLSFFLSFVLSFFHCSPPCSSCWVEFGPKALVHQKNKKTNLSAAFMNLGFGQCISIYLCVAISLVHSFIHLFIYSFVPSSFVIQHSYDLLFTVVSVAYHTAETIYNWCTWTHERNAKYKLVSQAN